MNVHLDISIEILNHQRFGLSIKRLNQKMYGTQFFSLLIPCDLVSICFFRFSLVKSVRSKHVHTDDGSWYRPQSSIFKLAFYDLKLSFYYFKLYFYDSTLVTVNIHNFIMFFFHFYASLHARICFICVLLC